MKISELRAREAFDVQMEETLRCVIQENEKTEQWFEHPLFSVYVTRGFCADGIRFLQSQYRYTPHFMRRIVQDAGVGILGLRPVFERMLKKAFELPAIENSANCMWMPGNQRVRLFDFKKRTVRVFAKAGFSKDGLQREITFRKEHAAHFDWLLPILSSDGEGFEEQLLEACPLDREPNENRRKMALELANRALEALHQIDAKCMSGTEYLDWKRTEWETAKAKLHEKFPGLVFDVVETIWDKASKTIKQQDNVKVSQTHGDFQAGNILISKTGDQIWLIDWEDIALRASIYDEMTLTLRSRFADGLYARVQDYLQSDIPNRELHVALWAIEEWIWLTETGAREGISSISTNLVAHFRECQRA